MSKIERKVEKKTRSRVVTIGTSLLIAIAIIASASLIDFYYLQTGTVNVTSALPITITEVNDPEDPDDDIVHAAGWEETVTIDILAGDGTYIYPGGNTYYTITNNGDTTETVYIHIDITEDPVPPGIEGEGLTVKVYDLTNSVLLSDGGQIYLYPYGNTDPNYADFEIHITADEYINAASTYGYTITMDWIPG